MAGSDAGIEGAGVGAGSCLTGSGAAAAVSTTGWEVAGAAEAADTTGSEVGAAATAASTWRNRSAGTDCGNGAELRMAETQFRALQGAARLNPSLSRTGLSMDAPLPMMP